MSNMAEETPTSLNKKIEEYKVAVTTATRRLHEATSELEAAKRTMYELEGGLRALMILKDKENG